MYRKLDFVNLFLDELPKIFDRQLIDLTKKWVSRKSNIPYEFQGAAEDNQKTVLNYLKYLLKCLCNVCVETY